MKLLGVRGTGKQRVPSLEGTVLFRGLFVLHLPFLPLKETVAVRLKRAILLLNLELKIPGGAAHGLCSPQVGGSLMRLTGLARGRFETVSDLLRPRLPYRAHLGTPGHGSGVYTVMKYSWLGVPAATRGGRRVASRKPWPESLAGSLSGPGRAGSGAERQSVRPGAGGPSSTLPGLSASWCFVKPRPRYSSPL